MTETPDARYRIQFTIDDVVDKIKEINGLEEDERKSMLIHLNHDLLSSLAEIANVASYVISKDEQTLNLHQRAYVSNLEALSVLAIYHLSELLSFNYVEDVVKEKALGFFNSLNSIKEFLPATPRVLELGDVLDKDLGDLLWIDDIFPLTFYFYNSLFSKDFKRDKYNLGGEIRAFWFNKKCSKEFDNSLRFRKPVVVNIETKVDYFSNVVIPLIHNVYDHAFNSANNVNHRSLDGSWSKHYQVVMRADEEKKEIVVQVRDNGFGISPDMMPNLFQKGASSKTDKTTEHGVGLWKVKKFVEDNGGRMWVQTKLGEETSFYFTIKYESKDRVYKQ